MKKDLRGSTDLTDLQRIRKLRDGSLSVREKERDLGSLGIWDLGERDEGIGRNAIRYIWMVLVWGRRSKNGMGVLFWLFHSLTIMTLLCQFSQMPTMAPN